MKRRLSDLALESVTAVARAAVAFPQNEEMRHFASRVQLLVADVRDLVREVDEMRLGIARLRGLPHQSLTSDAHRVLDSLPTEEVSGDVVDR